MTEIYGWFDTIIEKSALKLITDNIVDSRSCDTSLHTAQSEPAATLLLLTSNNHASHNWTTDGDISVVITGNPYWLDDELQAINVQQGAASSLVKAYQQYGTSLLQHLQGSFSFAISSSSSKTAFLAIDRLGIEPLNYSICSTQGLLFASSTDLIQHHPSTTGSIDPQALYDYLYFHVVPSPETIFSDTRKLEPAQCITYQNGKARIERYWQPKTALARNTRSTSELQHELHSHLRSAVARCHPDKQTGAFLSGGLDSSTITGVLAELCPDTAQAYTIGFSEDGYDEVGFARTAARHFGVKLNEYYVTPDDVSNALPEIAKAYDEPFGNSSAIPAYFCAKMARENGTHTLLAGDGGDELFAGNTRYAKQKIFNIYSAMPAVVRRSFLEPLFLGTPITEKLPLIRKIRSYISQARVPMPDRMESYNFLHRTPTATIFTDEFLTQIDTENPLKLLRKTYAQSSQDSFLDRMLFLDWKFTLADNDLRKVNRMCQLAGVDVHYPLLDSELVDFSTQIPSALKLKNLKLRHFYKEALCDFLPDEVINKSKHGFGLPFGEWLKTSPRLQDQTYTYLSQLKSRRIVQASFIDQLITTHREDHAAYYGTMVWVLAMLELWLQQHNHEIRL